MAVNRMGTGGRDRHPVQPIPYTSMPSPYAAYATHARRPCCTAPSQPPDAARLVGTYVTTTAMTDALERDAHTLLAAYDDGSWRPTEAEFELSGTLVWTIA
ncbi:hypothetical protein ACWCQQ_39215 [Streptomyces sp. NPDC002143]